MQHKTQLTAMEPVTSQPTLVIASALAVHKRRGIKKRDLKETLASIDGVDSKKKAETIVSALRKLGVLEQEEQYIILSEDCISQYLELSKGFENESIKLEA